MSKYPNSLSVKFNTFKGIRTRNGIAANGVISSVTCQNIDFAASSYDAGVVIQTSLGNVKICEYLSGYTLVKGFEFEIENNTLLIFYAEEDEAEIGTANKGKLLVYNFSTNTFTPISTYTYIDDNEDEQTESVTLTKTGEANAITMIDNAYNTFVFTNGIEYYAYCPDGTTIMQKLNPTYTDNNGNEIAVTGLAMCEQDGSLVIGSKQGLVIASAKGNITDWDYNAAESATKPWIQYFGKPVTAVVPYIDALLVFTPEDSTVLSGNFSNPTTSGATRQDASLGGCMSFESWVKHDKYIFFYDNNQKNIYYYMQNDYGQKVLGEPIAPEVQSFSIMLINCK